MTRLPGNTYRLALILTVHYLAFAWAVHLTATGRPDFADYAFSLAIGSTVVMACAQDARMRGRPVVHIGQFLMFVAWPIAGPLYLVRSRGWRGIPWAVVWVITVLLCYVGGGLLVQQIFASMYGG